MEPDLTPLIQLFKALGDESRLRIVALLLETPRSVEDLARTLRLGAPTVSHHLAKLRQVGLVDSERDQYYQVYRFCPEPLRAVARQLASARPVPPIEAPPDDDGDVLGHFLIDGRLVRIPAQRKKRAVVLAFLARQFEPSRRYPEAEVNERLRVFHDDVCTLRRELVMGKLLEREAGVYWRTPHDRPQAPRGLSH